MPVCVCVCVFVCECACVSVRVCAQTQMHGRRSRSRLSGCKQPLTGSYVSATSCQRTAEGWNGTAVPGLSGLIGRQIFLLRTLLTCLTRSPQTPAEAPPPDEGLTVELQPCTNHLTDSQKGGKHCTSHHHHLTPPPSPQHPPPPVSQ